jgi:cytochrome P450
VQAFLFICQVCRDIIAEKWAFLKTGVISRVDILSRAIQNRQFSDNGLTEQVMSFQAAEHETIESSIIWPTYILAMYPQIQQKLREEINHNLPGVGSGAGFTSDDINRLPFLKAVCNETLRISLPVRLTMREASENTDIQGIWHQRHGFYLCHKHEP